jgi:hypothetical protein
MLKSRNAGGTTMINRLYRSPWTWLVVSLLAGMALSLGHGLSNWWDLVNYHLYNPWALFHHRERMDIFPAGIQGYFDPLLDIPYYLIAYAWFPAHPAIVAALTGIPYGLLIFFTLLLSRIVLANAMDGFGPAARAVTLLATVVMAVSGAATWSQAFTTTNEVFVSVFVLGALILLISAFVPADNPAYLGTRRALMAGCLLGLAAGLKLTATIYAPACGLLLLATPGNWKSNIRNGFVFALAWTVAFVVVFGPWAVHLYARTGNPIFPMFNNIFHSALGTEIVGRDTRFVPASIREWFFAPFYWLNDRTQTVFPLPFRDARFALACVFGIVTIVAALCFGRWRPGARPQPLLVLTGFWFIGYGTWLAVFSMLRYAIVLEIGASLIAIGGLLYLLGRFARGWPGIARAGVTVLLAVATMSFAHIPDLGSVPIGSRTFRAEVPPLGDHALIILANQPMGLLAPLIERASSGASFIGIPGCFTPGQWCYNGFYNFGLGRHMRAKIASHTGPMYVAYYTDHMPIFAQLAAFRVSMDENACKTMHTNRTADVLLCRASYEPNLAATPRGPSQFRLQARTTLFDHEFRVADTWLSNPCTGDSNTLARMAFSWNASRGVDGVRIFVTSPPSFRPVSFSAGGAEGHAETGLWVKAAQTFVFTDASGRELARSSIRYEACTDH